MRRGINSYLSLDLALLGAAKSGFIKEIILGPKCAQNTGELNAFLLAIGFCTTIHKSKIEIVYVAHNFSKIITNRKAAIICPWEVTKETEVRKEQGRMTLL